MNTGETTRIDEARYHRTMRPGVVVAIAVGSAVVAGGLVIVNATDDDTGDRRREEYEVCAELVAAIDRYRSNDLGSDVLAVRRMIEELDAIAAQAVGTDVEEVARAAAEAKLEETPTARDAFLAECQRQGLIEQR